MRLSQVQLVEKKLSDFVGEFSNAFGRSDRCQKCGHYLCGLILDGDRKSIEPMASRIPNGNSQALQQFVLERDSELPIGTGQRFKWRSRVPMKRGPKDKHGPNGVLEGSLIGTQEIIALDWPLKISGNVRFNFKGQLLAAELPQPQTVVLRFGSSSLPLVSATFSKFIRVERTEQGRFDGPPYFSTIVGYQDELIWADTDSTGLGWGPRSWKDMKDATIAKRSRPYCYVHFLRWQSFLVSVEAPFAMGYGPVSHWPCFEGAACIRQFCAADPSSIPVPDL